MGSNAVVKKQKHLLVYDFFTNTFYAGLLRLPKKSKSQPGMVRTDRALSIDFDEIGTGIAAEMLAKEYNETSQDWVIIYKSDPVKFDTILKRKTKRYVHKATIFLREEKSADKPPISDAVTDSVRDEVLRKFPVVGEWILKYGTTESINSLVETPSAERK